MVRKSLKVMTGLLALSLVFSFSPLEELHQKEKKFLLENEKNTISTFQKNVNSVVNVSNIAIAKKSFFDLNPMEVPIGAGSGFVWDDKGHIVTNYHVISKADSYIITFHEDPNKYEAELIGSEPRQDIAVLKLKKMPKQLNPVEKGNSDKLAVGQKAMAIGNPFGLDHTITAGIVSALDREVKGIGEVTIRGMIQTDSSINPGNSGGPLLDSQGQLIGMNTMIFSSSGSSAGIGFAVPVQSIKRIVPQLIEHGKVIRPGLGVGVLPDQQRRGFGVKKGVVVTAVEKKGPAARAGLKGITQDRRGRYYLGDVIVGIDDHEIKNYDDIYHALDEYEVGDKVEVHYIRNDEKKSVKLELTQI